MKFVVNSNIYISLAAVFLTVQTQIQLGMKPQWHPYLFIIFFATFFEYNLHRFVTVLTNKEALNSPRHEWVRDNLKGFYGLTAISLIGFICAIVLAKIEVIVTLAPMAVITIFYSIPLFWNKKHIFRLREIPYLKIFLIAFVWSAGTILLPLIHAGLEFSNIHHLAIFIERFIFVFAITIPFDIRDMEADRSASLKTIPLLIKEHNSYLISYIAICVFELIIIMHYGVSQDWFLTVALSISAVTTLMFLSIKRIRSIPEYHYWILDGTLLLQGLLTLIFYYVGSVLN